MTDNLAGFGLEFVRAAKGTSCTKMITLFPGGQVRGGLKCLKRPSKFTNMHKLIFLCGHSQKWHLGKC